MRVDPVMFLCSIVYSRRQSDVICRSTKFDHENIRVVGDFTRLDLPVLLGTGTVSVRFSILVDTIDLDFRVLNLSFLLFKGFYSDIKDCMLRILNLSVKAVSFFFRVRADSDRLSFRNLQYIVTQLLGISNFDAILRFIK